MKIAFLLLILPLASAMAECELPVAGVDETSSPADGFIAVGLGLSEPIVRPFKRTASCVAGEDSTTAKVMYSVGCFPLGFVEGVGRGAYDIVLGAIDILTIGQLGVSRAGRVIGPCSDRGI